MAIWLGVNVIGLVFVVGWECGLVGMWSWDGNVFYGENVSLAGMCLGINGFVGMFCFTRMVVRFCNGSVFDDLLLMVFVFFVWYAFNVNYMLFSDVWFALFCFVVVCGSDCMCFVFCFFIAGSAIV